MQTLLLQFEDGTQRRFRARLPISIGRDQHCELRIRAWRVARHHAVLERRAAGIFINDQGALAGTFVNGNRVAEYGPLSHQDEIIIGPCLIRLSDDDTMMPLQGFLGNAPHGHALASGQSLQVEVGADLLPSLPVESASSEGTGVALSVDDRSASAADGAVFSAAHGEGLTAEREGIISSQRERAGHRRRLHLALLEALDLRRRDIAAMSDDALRSEASTVLEELIASDTEIPETLDRAVLLREVVDEAVGLGPLEPLLSDPAITEIMVNRYDELFVETAGQLKPHAGTFSSEQAVLGIIERIVSPLGRRIDESSPMVDARLQDGSRVNAIIPPVALRGASITIRKFPTKRPKMADLLCVGALDAYMGKFLEACVVQRKNIVVSGGTGSGKTTLLNVLSNCIPANERIVTIEDAAELQLAHSHLVALEARPANLEGKGAISIRDLVRNALRMRPDRIVVGECRGAEAFDMLAAMNTGHEGSLTTLHANSPRDALSRLETMILMAGMDLPLAAVREHVASSLDILVQQARLSSGHRVITSVVQVTGQESGRIQLQELFRYHPGPPPAYHGCGVIPDNLDLQKGGLDISMFNQRAEILMRSGGWHLTH